MTPAQQMNVFAAMLLCGIALGAAYDVLWMLRRTFLKGKIARILTDLFFGVLCAAGIIAAALHLRTDAFRWYTLLGAAAGMAFYAGTVGRFLRWMDAACVRFVKKSREKNGK